MTPDNRRQRFLLQPRKQQSSAWHSGRSFAVSRTVAFAATAVMASSVLGMGLGEPVTSSSLGDPLILHIPLSETNGWREDQITVTLGGQSAPLLRGLAAQLNPVPGGYQIEVHSTQLIKEPYIAITVEVRWPEGTLLRDYDILLDPPRAGQQSL